MPGHENLRRVASVLPDILDGPRDGRGCILDIRWRFDIRIQAITRRNDSDTFVFKAIGNPAAPAGQPAAVEPDHGCKAFGLRVVYIHTAARLDAFVALWIFPIGDVPDGCMSNLLGFLSG